MLSPDPEVPYISIVAVARDGGKNDTSRAFVESWTRQAARLGLSSEVIVVAPSARNSGIFRARGEFILSTEIEVSFSEELMQFLASRQLQKGKLYRIDCHEGSRLHAREGSFQLSADGLRENQPRDIAGAGSGIHFGEGWFPAELDPAAGELYRWIENGAEVILRVPASGEALTLEFEPGPGVGPLPQVLQVLDAAGDKVAEWSVGGRASVQLWVPPAAKGTRQTFRFCVPDGGRPLVDDLRILNFRCFRCDWVQPRNLAIPQTGVWSKRSALARLVGSGGPGALPRAIRLLRALGDDIFGAGIAYWGQGWHRLEESGTERYRWVSTDAELVVRIEDKQQDLCVLVEPGPSLKGRPFQLQIRLAGGKVIGSVRVRGLTYVRVPLPFAVGTVTTVFLNPDMHGEALPGDSRVLNFRVLACACEASERPLAPADLVRPAGWTAVTVSAKPAGIDWAAKLKDRRRELTEIGKPAFLHVNVCDFVLMDRERWFDLRGYTESDHPAAYLNTLFCYTAHFAGATEEVLRAPLRVERAPSAGRSPAVLDEDMVWLITQMRRLHAPAILNLATWGVET
jgi:hypothetical protein